MPNQNWVFWQSQVWLSNLLCIGRRKLPKRHVNDARSSPISGEMWWMIEGHAYVAPKAAARCPNPANDDRSLSLSFSLRLLLKERQFKFQRNLSWRFNDSSPDFWSILMRDKGKLPPSKARISLEKPTRNAWRITHDLPRNSSRLSTWQRAA